MIALIPIIALTVFIVLRNRRRKQEALAAAEEEEKRKIEQEAEAIELDIKESGKKKSIEDLIDKNPEIVTQLLKTWIEEE